MSNCLDLRQGSSGRLASHAASIERAIAARPSARLGAGSR
jgi:hypothetical protein